MTEVAAAQPRSRQLLRAKLIFPNGHASLDDGVIEIIAGRVTQVRPFAGDADRCVELVDLGDVAVLPALVNAHTHLELSDFQQPIPVTGTFTDWVKQIAPYRGGRDETAAANALRQGLIESSQSGVAAVGDIAQISDLVGMASQSDNYHSRATVIYFAELLGFSHARYGDNLESLRQLLASPSQLRLGISPHATYTVHTELLTACVELSRQHQLPLAMHVAESSDEVELIRSGTGPLQEFFADLGIWYPGLFPPRPDFCDWIQMLAAAPQSLIIHGNYLGQAEWKLLAENRERQTVVYCPRTHSAFGHSEYPLRAMLDAGVQVAVGTDSRASNPDLHLWRELQTIYQKHPGVSPAEILEMGTKVGAAALGLSKEFGEIAPGRCGRFCVHDLSNIARDDDPLESLLNAQTLPQLWVS